MKGILYKTGMVDAIAAKTGISKKTIREVLDAQVETITAAVTGGHDVRVSGLGTFKLGKRAARMGRNPNTGEAVAIPEKTVVRFAVATQLKQAVK